MKMFIRILFFTMIFIYSGKNHKFLYSGIQHQEKSSLQLSEQQPSVNHSPVHALNKNQYCLDKETDNYKDPNFEAGCSFLKPELLVLFNHLFPQSADHSLSNLKAETGAIGYTSPRYILHHNLRIPFC